jgi:diguanylate cyclase (GGDEF)-like protein
MTNDNIKKGLSKKNISLNIAKKYLYKLSSKSNNKEIIDSLKNIKQYGVLSMPAFRTITDDMINKSPQGTIIMADINDLYAANKGREKEEVNGMIKKIINKIRDTLDENECINYKIAKMGDEIYIYTPDKNEQEANAIIDELHTIMVDELTISAGASSDLSKGLINAINEADKKMTINKSNFKSERLRSVCGNNLEKITNTIVETQLEKMRINLKQLKNSNASDLRNTFDRAIEQLDLEKIPFDISAKEQPQSLTNEDSFENLKNIYASQAKALYGNNPQLINEYVLANMLSKHPVEGVIQSEFFQGLEYKKAYKNIKEDKESKSFEILAIDLSGLKTINDTLGHEEGDKAIADSLYHLKTTLESQGIKTYSDIIVKSGGDSYVLTEELTKNNKDNVINDVQNYGTNDNAKYNMSIICSIQNINKNNLNMSNFLDVVNNNLTKVENNLEEQSFNRKLNDVEEMKNSIIKIYQQIINMDDVQLLLKGDTDQKEKVIKMIKAGFENCIENEKDDSHIDKSKDNLYLAKENVRTSEDDISK